MVKGIEYHGRLSRRDGRPANPGVYHLQVGLHSDERTRRVYWREEHSSVEVSSGGFFSIILGRVVALKPDWFESGPCWVSVCVVRRGKVEDETGRRVPLVGASLALADRLEGVATRLQRLEEAHAANSSKPQPEVLAQRISEISEAVQELRETVLPQLDAQLGESLKRLRVLDGDDGRVELLEDRLEDIDGSDGDIVDLTERMDLFERKAPELFHLLKNEPRRQDRIDERLAQLEREARSVADLLDASSLSSSGNPLEPPPLPDPEDIGAVRRAGDVMTGGLTINRGGLEVVSGGIRSRSAHINTLDASKVIKSPKVIVDALELRGDLTVDNLHRAVQVRRLEGRQSSGRRDGILHINGRGGAEVIVGNADSAAGMQVHGAVRADELRTEGADVAERFPCDVPVEAGQLVRLVGEGRRVTLCDRPYDRRVVGVVSELPGLVLGTDGVCVALKGTVPCRVLGPVEVGDPLTSSERPGVARVAVDPLRAHGALIGKAMAAVGEGEATIPVLVL